MTVCKISRLSSHIFCCNLGTVDEKMQWLGALHGVKSEGLKVKELAMLVEMSEKMYEFAESGKKRDIGTGQPGQILQ